jgi:hypothetical protein
MTRIRNLGRRTGCEIKTRMLLFGCDKLTENEKKRFFCEVTARNGKL